MNKHFNPAISEEKFAAWLDGMLPADEMRQIETLIENDSELQECAAISEAIDTEIQDYINDEFLYQTDMEMLDESYIEIPSVEMQGLDSTDTELEINTDTEQVPNVPLPETELPIENEFTPPIDDTITSEDIYNDSGGMDDFQNTHIFPDFSGDE